MKRLALLLLSVAVVTAAVDPVFSFTSHSTGIVGVNLTSAFVVIKSEPSRSRLPAYAQFLVTSVLKRARTAAWSVQPACTAE